MDRIKKLDAALWTMKVVAAVVLFLLLALSGHFAPANSQPRKGCGLGTVWDEYEVGSWNGTWTRRGDSSTFDAVYRWSGYEDVTSVLDISISGDSVSVSRTDTSGTSSMKSCKYEGTLGSDGVSVSGTYSCVAKDGTKTPTYSWDATIGCPSDDSNNVIDLAGSWESDFKGKWSPTSIRQEGNKLSFTNELGDTSEGSFQSRTRVKATQWEGGLGATIQNNGNTIKWDNGTTWRRRR